MRTVAIVFSAVILFFAFFSCNDSVNNSGDIVFPDSNVSFQNHVRPFLLNNCSYQGCHSDETAAGGRRMTDYFSLMDVSNVGLVVPYQPDNSLLINIIEEKIIHTPLIRWYITDNQKKGMRKWIEEGAQNN